MSDCDNVVDCSASQKSTQIFLVLQRDRIIQAEKLALLYDIPVRDMLTLVVTTDASRYQAPDRARDMSSSP